ncbi:hypothetical protein AX14_000617, partial [Amanita brunnescens Koide BX004]
TSLLITELGCCHPVDSNDGCQLATEGFILQESISGWLLNDTSYGVHLDGLFFAVREKWIVIILGYGTVSSLLLASLS